jgi:hypothetical protein
MVAQKINLYPMWQKIRSLPNSEKETFKNVEGEEEREEGSTKLHQDEVR